MAGKACHAFGSTTQFGLTQALGVTKMLRALPSVLVALLLVSCSDEVQKTYANRKDALEKGQVANGWLPVFVPASAEQIRTINNLDLNTSEGSFRFKPEEWGSFLAHLQPTSKRIPPFANWARTTERYRSTGHEVWWYEEEGTTWVFFCKPREGKCEHLMWMQREAVAAPG